MSLIDSNYFVGDILITNKDKITVSLQSVIDKYEKEILISLLGYELYDLMINDQNTEPYKSLIEGAEFTMTFDGIEQKLKWEGFKNTAKQSLIAYYVYYKYQDENFIQPSGVGAIQAQAENADIISPYSKMVNAWNEMIALYGYFDNYWFTSSNTCIIQPDGSRIFNNAPSAYNYMIANIESFPKWIFTPLRMINHFGI